MDLVLVLIGLLLLIAGGKALLKSALGLSQRSQISRMAIGMTVVSFATSAPELLVSVKAALEGYPALSLGNVIGSNIANLGFILAMVLLISPLEIKHNFYKTDWPILIAASLLLFIFLYDRQYVARWQGLLMIGLLCCFLFYLLKFYPPPAAAAHDQPAVHSIALIITLLIAGSFSLWAGSELLIKGAVGLARAIGLSNRVISITLISVGTSIPELTTSILAAVRREKAILLGNLVGSNIFNILGVLGITTAIHPLVIQHGQSFNADLIWLLAYAFALYPLTFLSKKRQLGHKAGAVLFLFYIIFIFCALR